MDWSKIKRFIKGWIFQGIRYYSTTEILFKIIFESLLVLITFVMYIFKIFSFASLLFFLFLIHTVNWLINGNGLVLIFKFFNFKHSDIHNKIDNYLASLRQYGSKKPYIHMIVICGSVVRNEIHATSDLDVLIVRRKGFINAIRSWLFGVLERTKAIFNLFPLDLTIVDDASELKTKFTKGGDDLVLFNSVST